MILSFSNFLIESLDVEKLKHLEHVEDHIIHGGDEGVKHAADTLSDVHDILHGNKSDTKITTKYDGAPSLVFGVHPQTKKFFVGTKSVFNKDPKINYDDEDIERNHGHAPGLVEKLKTALQHLPKIMPKSGGVYQGDVMYSRPDVTEHGNQYSFTPNTITYKTDKDSEHGKKIAKAKMGIVVHTKYDTQENKPFEDAKASFDVDHSKFQQHPDVHTVNPEVNNASINDQEKKEYDKHIGNATKLYSSMSPRAFESIDGHEPTMKMFINKCVASDTKPTTDGYRAYVMERGQKDIDKVKTDAAKQKKSDALNASINNLDTNKEDFDDVLKLHHHLQKAKDTLTSSLARSADTGFKTYIGDKETKPEGFVAIRNGRPSKFVDRAEFSRSNFLAGQFRKDGDQKPENEDAPVKPVVMSFGRMNPPTIGHKALVDKVLETARENNAPHHVILSASQDPEKNPLSPEQKLKHAKRAFPGANVSVASEDNPNIIDHARKLWKNGHDHLIYVAGSDRVPETKKALDLRNGKDYAFKKIDVVSAGQRDPDAEDVEGMSASKMRAHAMARQISRFKSGLPEHMSDEHKNELYHDVRRGMHIDITPDMPGATLAKHAKREDEIGHRARAEQERRLAAKKTTKK